MMGWLINTSLIVLAVATVVLMCAARNGTKGAGKAAAVCVALTLVAAILSMLPQGRENEMKAARQTHERYQQVCGTFISEQLAATHPGARVVLLTAPQAEELPQGAGHTILVEYLKASLENEGLQVTLHPLDIPKELMPPDRGNDEQAMGMEFLIMDTFSWFDSRRLALVLAELAPRADLVVSTVDVGGRIGPESLPRSGRGPGLVLLNTPVDEIGAAMNQTVLQAVLLPRNHPEARKPGAPIPEELETAFNQRFLWVTRENVATLDRQGLLP